MVKLTARFQSDFILPAELIEDNDKTGIRGNVWIIPTVGYVNALTKKQNALFIADWTVLVHTAILTAAINLKTTNSKTAQRTDKSTHGRRSACIEHRL